MIKDIRLNESQASCLSAQLWRYYDIDASVHLDCSLYTGNDKLGEYYRVFYDSDSGITDVYVKMRVLDEVIEDLYLIVGNDIIEPTTTREEQELR